MEFAPLNFCGFYTALVGSAKASSSADADISHAGDARVNFSKALPFYSGTKVLPPDLAQAAYFMRLANIVVFEPPVPLSTAGDVLAPPAQ